jgi:hypothetical protein
MDFYGDLPVVLRNQLLVAYSNTFVESGRATLAGLPQKIWVQGDDAFVFYGADTRGVWALRVPLSQLNVATPGLPVDPNGLAYTPDAVEFGEGIVYLLSRGNLSVFRWSVAEHKYLATIPLTEAPTSMAYAVASHRLYLAYPSGRISYFANGAPGPETGFANLPQQSQGIAAAGEFLFACDPSGAWGTHYIFNAAGQLLSQKDWNYYSREFIWNPASRKMYFFRDDTSPNDLIWEDIDLEGKIGAQKDTPYHDSTGFLHPIRLFPDGSRVLLGSGRIFDAISLELVDTLSNDVVDASWLGSRLLTLRANGSATELQEWGDRFAVKATRSLDGAPVRLFGGTTVWWSSPPFRECRSSRFLPRTSPQLPACRRRRHPPRRLRPPRPHQVQRSLRRRRPRRRQHRLPRRRQFRVPLRCRRRMSPRRPVGGRPLATAPVTPVITRRRLGRMPSLRAGVKLFPSRSTRWRWRTVACFIRRTAISPPT